MPVTTSATRKLRVDRKRREVNLPVISRMKNALKRAQVNPTPELIKKAYSAIDKAKKKEIIKTNKAARLKSRLVKSVKNKMKSSPFGVKKS